jgi:hypothetical protein
MTGIDWKAQTAQDIPVLEKLGSIRAGWSPLEVAVYCVSDVRKSLDGNDALELSNSIRKIFFGEI